MAKITSRKIDGVAPSFLLPDLYNYKSEDNGETWQKIKRPKSKRKKKKGRLIKGKKVYLGEYPVTRGPAAQPEPQPAAFRGLDDLIRTGHAKRLHVRFSFAWYDFWVGFYYDRERGALYFCPAPCLVFKFYKS